MTQECQQQLHRQKRIITNWSKVIFSMMSLVFTIEASPDKLGRQQRTHEQEKVVMEKSHHLWLKLLIGRVSFSVVLHKCKQLDIALLRGLCSRLVPFHSMFLNHIFYLLLYNICSVIFSPITIYYLCKNFTQLIHQESTNWWYKKFFQTTHLHWSSNSTALMKSQSMR